MMRRYKIFILIFLLLPTLSGCWLSNMPVYVPPHVPSQTIPDAPPVQIEQTPAVSIPAHGRFTLRYEPAHTLNPIITLNRDNISITSLLYESLFILDANLMPVPLLCDTWDTEDNITFTLTIFPDIPMHDGSTLTANDVAYSLRQARTRGRHRNKLHRIVSVSSDGDLTVTVTLESANARFLRLLDIPIIKADSIDSDIPPGTGPYMFPNPDNLMLLRFPEHRDYPDMPLTTIYLKACSDSELTEMFDQGMLSLLWDDPSSAFEIRINRDHETRYYITSSLQFLGFNASTAGVLRNSDVRRAIGCAFERQHIVDQIMNNPRQGQTFASPVAISPEFDMYDSSWERNFDPLFEMSALLERSGIEDYDADGYLEIYDGVGGGGIDFELVFIVNIENSHKAAAAEYIATSLRQSGFVVDLRLLAWSDFMRALNNGDFDMYYGEVQIGADFDFSPLLMPGDNFLNYGNTGNTAYLPLIENFLAASTQEEVSAAGKELCDSIHTSAPFVPILYKRHVIYTPLGVVSGAAPTQSGVFYNFKDWSIDTQMLT